MRNFRNLIGLFILSLLVASCSNTRKTLDTDTIVSVVEGKQLISCSIDSSDDLSYDYPYYITILYLEDGKVYRQTVGANGVNEVTEQTTYDPDDYFTADFNTLLADFDSEKAFNNAIDILNEMSDDGFEYFSMRTVSFTIKRKIFSEVPVYKRSMVIQATKKGEDSKTKLKPGRRIETTTNYYEFNFTIEEGSKVIYEGE